jgi:hypothetical protein
MPQSPFDAEPEQLRQYLQQARDQFKFTVEPFPDTVPENTPYVLALKRYWKSNQTFVAKVVETANEIAAKKNKPSPFRDEDALKWADDISQIVPGFPNGKELILGGDTLIIDVLAKIMWNLSFSHTMDHYTYYCIPWNVNPWRLRLPIPESRDEAYDFDNCHDRVDMWKFVQCMEVFFYTGSSTSTSFKISGLMIDYFLFEWFLSASLLT